MNDDVTPRLYTYQEVAERLRVHVRTVYNRFRHRPLFRCGNIVRIPEPELQRFLQEHLRGRPGHKPGRKPGPG